MTLTTLYASNNSQSGNMFGVVALQKVSVRSFDLNLRPGAVTVEIYWRTGTRVGHDDGGVDELQRACRSATWPRAIRASSSSKGPA